MSGVNVVYLVEMIESERGWGQRPDGYLAFRSEQNAINHIRGVTKDRTGPAPEVYTIYNPIGYKECSQSFLDKLLAKGEDGRVYIDRMRELTE